MKKDYIVNIKNIFNSWFWKDLWYNQISTRYNPRNKWANDIIPRQYSDKVELIPNFLFAAITNFVDKKNGEDCFGRIDWTTNIVHRKVAKQIKQIYMWAKYDRPKCLIKLDNSYPEKPEGMDFLGWVNDNSVPYKIKYKNVIKYENLIRRNDDKYLKMIVEIREYLWT